MMERWKRREAKTILILSLIVGMVIGIVFAQSSGFHGILTVYRDDVVFPQDSVVTAQSLQNTTGYSFSFPPPLFVFEGIDFLVDVSNVSGGVLHLNFTRNDHVVRTETVFPGQATKISSSHDEYRLGYSATDIVLWVTDGDVRISYLWMEIDRRHRGYHPLLMGLQFVVFAFFIIIPLMNWYHTRTLNNSRK